MDTRLRKRKADQDRVGRTLRSGKKTLLSQNTEGVVKRKRKIQISERADREKPAKYGRSTRRQSRFGGSYQEVDGSDDDDNGQVDDDDQVLDDANDDAKKRPLQKNSDKYDVETAKCESDVSCINNSKEMLTSELAKTTKESNMEGEHEFYTEIERKEATAEKSLADVTVEGKDEEIYSDSNTDEYSASEYFTGSVEGEIISGKEQEENPNSNVTPQNAYEKDGLHAEEGEVKGCFSQDNEKGDKEDNNQEKMTTKTNVVIESEQTMTTKTNVVIESEQTMTTKSNAVIESEQTKDFPQETECSEQTSASPETMTSSREWAKDGEMTERKEVGDAFVGKKKTLDESKKSDLMFVSGQGVMSLKDGKVKEKVFAHGIRCTKCPKLCATVHQFNTHLQSHEEKKFKCSECGQLFRRPASLQVHMRCHSNTKPYVCDVCGASFRHDSSLTIHLRNHRKEKNYKCPKCKKGFVSLTCLNKHMRRTCFKGQNACTECGIVFSTKEAQKFHVQQDHKGHDLNKASVKTFECGECKRLYQTRENLYRHQETKHNLERRWKCTLCAERFVDRYSAVSHVIDAHKLTREDAWKHTVDWVKEDEAKREKIKKQRVENTEKLRQRIFIEGEVAKILGLSPPAGSRVTPSTDWSVQNSMALQTTTTHTSETGAQVSNAMANKLSNPSVTAPERLCNVIDMFKPKVIRKSVPSDASVMDKVMAKYPVIMPRPVIVSVNSRSIVDDLTLAREEDTQCVPRDATLPNAPGTSYTCSGKPQNVTSISEGCAIDPSQARIADTHSTGKNGKQVTQGHLLNSAKQVTKDAASYSSHKESAIPLEGPCLEKRLSLRLPQVDGSVQRATTGASPVFSTAGVSTESSLVSKPATSDTLKGHKSLASASTPAVLKISRSGSSAQGVLPSDNSVASPSADSGNTPQSPEGSGFVLKIVVNSNGECKVDPPVISEEQLAAAICAITEFRKNVQSESEGHEPADNKAKETQTDQSLEEKVIHTEAPSQPKHDDKTLDDVAAGKLVPEETAVDQLVSSESSTEASLVPSSVTEPVTGTAQVLLPSYAAEAPKRRGRPKGCYVIQRRGPRKKRIPSQVDPEKLQKVLSKYPTLKPKPLPPEMSMFSAGDQAVIESESGMNSTLQFVGGIPVPLQEQTYSPCSGVARSVHSGNSSTTDAASIVVTPGASNTCGNQEGNVLQSSISAAPFNISGQHSKNSETSSHSLACIEGDRTNGTSLSRIRSAHNRESGEGVSSTKTASKKSYSESMKLSSPSKKASSESMKRSSPSKKSSSESMKKSCPSKKSSSDSMETSPPSTKVSSESMKPSSPSMKSSSESMKTSSPSMKSSSESMKTSSPSKKSSSESMKTSSPSTKSSSESMKTSSPSTKSSSESTKTSSPSKKSSSECETERILEEPRTLSKELSPSRGEQITEFRMSDTPASAICQLGASSVEAEMLPQSAVSSRQRTVSNSDSPKAKLRSDSPKGDEGYAVNNLPEHERNIKIMRKRLQKRMNKPKKHFKEDSETCATRPKAGEILESIRKRLSERLKASDEQKEIEKTPVCPGTESTSSGIAETPKYDCATTQASASEQEPGVLDYAQQKALETKSPSSGEDHSSTSARETNISKSDLAQLSSAGKRFHGHTPLIKQQEVHVVENGKETIQHAFGKLADKSVFERNLETRPQAQESKKLICHYKVRGGKRKKSPKKCKERFLSGYQPLSEMRPLLPKPVTEIFVEMGPTQAGTSPQEGVVPKIVSVCSLRAVDPEDNAMDTPRQSHHAGTGNADMSVVDNRTERRPEQVVPSSPTSSSFMQEKHRSFVSNGGLRSSVSPVGESTRDAESTDATAEQRTKDDQSELAERDGYATTKFRPLLPKMAAPIYSQPATHLRWKTESGQAVYRDSTLHYTAAPERPSNRAVYDSNVAYSPGAVGEYPSSRAAPHAETQSHHRSPTTGRHSDALAFNYEGVPFRDGAQATRYAQISPRAAHPPAPMSWEPQRGVPLSHPQYREHSKSGVPYIHDTIPGEEGAHERRGPSYHERPYHYADQPISSQSRPSYPHRSYTSQMRYPSAGYQNQYPSNVREPVHPGLSTDVYRPQGFVNDAQAERYPAQQYIQTQPYRTIGEAHYGPTRRVNYRDALFRRDRGSDVLVECPDNVYGAYEDNGGEGVYQSVRGFETIDSRHEQLGREPVTLDEECDIVVKQEPPDGESRSCGLSLRPIILKVEASLEGTCHAEGSRQQGHEQLVHVKLERDTEQ